MADIARRGVDQVVNLGDSLSGPLLPRETAECLRQQAWLHLAGNHERQLLTLPVDRMGASDAHTRARLDAETLQWLAAQRPAHRHSADVFFCHGSPRSDVEYFLETLTPHGLRLAIAREIAERRGDTLARLIACGHTHVPRALRAADGCLIVNPGSVGLPGYDDEHPWPHWVDTGSPDARYAIVERAPDGAWCAELLAVPYDHAAMVKLARRNARPDWAEALATGYALRPPA